jgi:hypothetical protein
MIEADPMRWVLRGVAGGTLALGWLFILWQNNFHVTVPVVVIGLGYLAVVATVANLWRVGAAAVAPEDNSADAWGRPIGARVELEKEKKTLLKAIKEAEFDHEMGKLSKADADDLIRTYRARAIEVIKEIDRLDAGQAGSTREKIEREVQARLALDSKASKKDKKKAAADAKAKADSATAKPEAAKAKADESTAKPDAAKTKAAEADADEAKAKGDKARGDEAKAKADEVKTDDAKADAAEPPPESAPENNDASEATP